MATIKDIASKLGISVSAVSKSLNGASDISEELRQLVLDTAVELGYSTKRSRKQEHRKLALFIENMDYASENDFGYDIILGFKQNAFKNNWDVDMIPVNPTFQLQEKYDTYMLKCGYSGAFIVGFALNDEWMKQFATTTMPTVLFDNFIRNNPNTCYVGTDNYEGIDTAIEHLYKLGHEKIAFLNGSLHSMVSEQRQDAFLQGMAGHGLKVHDELLAYGYYVADSAKYHVPAFLENGATAIMCGNDLIASGVVEECKARGLKVPEDISVIGFDDIPIASSMTPALTTVNQNRLELGKGGYAMLTSLISGIAISKALMRPKLVVRKSTAKAKASK
ncbi:MAG: LacI family DNA-binding transcriptional regulator [Lachnospiraceae bacterium]|nr:LacI family DNA-binding transcriptional regulator [Lachnospiraceae bacterium]